MYDRTYFDSSSQFMLLFWSDTVNHDGSMLKWSLLDNLREFFTILKFFYKAKKIFNFSIPSLLNIYWRLYWSLAWQASNSCFFIISTPWSNRILRASYDPGLKQMCVIYRFFFLETKDRFFLSTLHCFCLSHLVLISWVSKNYQETPLPLFSFKINETYLISYSYMLGMHRRYFRLHLTQSTHFTLHC